MRSFLFVLLAGCAVSPVVVEEDSRSLIGGPELTQQEEAPLSATEVINSIDGSVEGSCIIYRAGWSFLVWDQWSCSLSRRHDGDAGYVWWKLLRV